MLFSFIVWPPISSFFLSNKILFYTWILLWIPLYFLCERKLVLNESTEHILHYSMHYFLFIYTISTTSIHNFPIFLPLVLISFYIFQQAFEITSDTIFSSRRKEADEIILLKQLRRRVSLILTDLSPLENRQFMCNLNVWSSIFVKITVVYVNINKHHQKMIISAPVIYQEA